MPAAFSFAMSAMNAVQFVGPPLMPAFLKRSLLYQKPTTPRLNGTPYCLPFTCQPAAAPPIVLIHGFTYFVRSATLCAFTWSTSSPPPHCWNTSGGLFDWSAIGIFVFCSASFWIGTDLTFTFGWSLWNSFATLFQSVSPTPCVALCHQTSVTVFCCALGAATVELATTTATVATAMASTSSLRTFIESSLGQVPTKRACWPSTSRGQFGTAILLCQPISTPFSIWSSIAV